MSSSEAPTAPAPRPPAAARPPARRAAAAAALALVLVVGLTWWGRDRAPTAEVVAGRDVVPALLDAGASAGTLAPDDAPGRGGRHLDAFVYSTDTEEPLTFTVAGAFEPTLAVETPDGRVVVGAAVADPHVAEVGGLAGKGRYTVTVSSRMPGATGRYLLSVEQPPVPFEAVIDGQPRPSELGVRGRARPDGRYEDRHVFEARRGQPYLVVLEADSQFAHVVVRSPEGDSLREAAYERMRTSRGTFVAVARFTPRYAHRYTVAAVSDEPGGTGNYFLTVRTQRAEAVALGFETLHGVLGVVSTLRGDRYVDTFSFPGQAGRRVTVGVRASGFGPAVTIVAPGGGTVASGGGTAEAVLPADGRYRVEVTSGRPRATGAYSITLAGGPAPAAAAPPPAAPDRFRTAEEMLGLDSLGRK